ncbi:MAG TPA: bi-domain-containing oxidoreductase [Steroidobacteraceae bacterium]|nr:bi-domain-containing oxidoreductase [Steroidobacteraceae bacterium]
MKQILQHLRSGATCTEEVPAPLVGRGQLRIATTRTLISSGTERMLVEFGKAGLIEKARQQPDKVRMVLEKLRTDGLASTLQVVRSKLEQPLPLGYCNVGRVLEVGAGVSGFAAGDRVASNGKHAEIVCVPQNLCARVPDTVGDESAAFTVPGAIALQGVRLVAPTLGETVVVTGLGLVGLLAVQLLRAHGCRVLGIDFDAERLRLARTFGAEVVDLAAGADPVAAARSYSRGRGVDAVVIAAATASSEPVHQAALMCRKRGRIVLVGVVGLELSRADFFEKELTFQVSCSYGPGRYDPGYEDAGHDYPVGFVRWTEQRNFEAVLDLLADGRLDVTPLVSHRFPLERATEAYALLTARTPSLGIVLEYPEGEAPAGAAGAARLATRVAVTPPGKPQTGEVVLGLIGSGNYATQVLIPALRAAGARLKSVVSSTGVSAVHAARRNALEEAGTDPGMLLADPEIGALVVSTRHDSHARYVLAALAAGKHLFVEKPLCVSAAELAAVRDAWAAARATGHGGPLLMVGFNRRFAPHAQRVKALLAAVREPKVFILTVNAGAVPAEHWTQDHASGGGRIIGEACHFIDLLRFLAGAPVAGFKASCIGGDATHREDKASITLEFTDGSIGTIHYAANGHRSFPKERLEVFCAGRILQLDNFRTLRAWGWPGLTRHSLWRQDKGQRACARAFVAAVRSGGASPIPFEELIEVAQLTLDVDDALRSRP